MYRYPVEVLSDLYLSRIGGFSEELDRREIGINSKALEINTSIIANETYADLRFFDETKPYFLKKKFLVVGVDENMKSYSLTRNGEVVLPENLREVYESKKGKEVLINTVEFFRIDGDYSKVVEAFLWRLKGTKNFGIRERRN
jgi:bifunctional DNA-binding transcriptional regulator/antitoxin component of YhaV-PrlF toxin-antitoxin module